MFPNPSEHAGAIILVASTPRLALAAWSSIPERTGGKPCLTVVVFTPVQSVRRSQGRRRLHCARLSDMDQQLGYR